MLWWFDYIENCSSITAHEKLYLTLFFVLAGPALKASSIECGCTYTQCYTCDNDTEVLV